MIEEVNSTNINEIERKTKKKGLKDITNIDNLKDKNNINNKNLIKDKVDVKKQLTFSIKNKNNSNVNEEMKAIKINNYSNKKFITQCSNYDIKIKTNLDKKYLSNIDYNTNSVSSINNNRNNSFCEYNKIECNSFNKNLLSNLLMSNIKQNSNLNNFSNENKRLLEVYGYDSFNYILQLEKTYIYSNMFEFHRLNHLVRTKMVDWILDVISILKLSDETFFLSIHILDTYIFKKSNIKEALNDSDIHIIGLVAILISSKYQASSNIGIDFIYEFVGYKVFTKKEIIEKELEVIKVIGFESLIASFPNEFISSHFYDFVNNNRKSIKSRNVLNLIKFIELKSYYFSKLITHFHEFNVYSSSEKSLICIVIAFDSEIQDISDNKNLTINNTQKDYIKNWIKYIISNNKSKFNYKELYDKFVKYVNVYKSLNFISFSLDYQFSTILKNFNDELNDISL